jgi:hypothetical protein
LEHWPPYDLATEAGRDEYRRQVMAALDQPFTQRITDEGVVTVELPR